MPILTVAHAISMVRIKVVAYVPYRTDPIQDAWLFLT